MRPSEFRAYALREIQAHGRAFIDPYLLYSYGFFHGLTPSEQEQCWGSRQKIKVTYKNFYSVLEPIEAFSQLLDELANET